MPIRKLARSLAVFALIFSFVLVSLPRTGYSQSPPPPAASTDYSKQLQTIEDKLEERRKALGIPGVSLVIVKDDQIIYMKGLGYKNFEKKVAVTPDTQFAIGSATKAFTALSVLMSQDEGKLSIDDSPKKYLPYFKMYDPETDKNILLRDLMCHASGLNRTDFAMMTGKLTRQELIQVAAQAKPTAKLREKFQYQNIMFTAAGEIASVVQQVPYDQLIANRIFKPLGMTNSTMSMKAMGKAKDYSYGYNYNPDTKKTGKLPFRDIDEVAPAGSINSSASDMAQWLRLVLNGGAVNGKRLVSEKGYEEWLKPQIRAGGVVSAVSYGFGWFLRDWNGFKVVEHGGNIDGFNSQVAMIPEKKLGFVLLTNVSASPLGSELMPIVWQNLLGDIKTDENSRLTFRLMERLIGKYRFEAENLDVEVKIAGEDLVLAIPGQPLYKLQRTAAARSFRFEGLPDGFGANLQPATGDTTELELTQSGRTMKLFRINPDGTVAKAVATPTPLPATGAAKELVGKYESDSNGRTAEVKESDGRVTFTVEGQQPFTLAEKGKDTYRMEPLPDTYFITVQRDAAGKIQRLIVTQPEGEFGFKNAAYTGSGVGITAGELMRKTIEAAGGEANIRKVTSRVSTFDIDLVNEGVQANGTSWTKAPNKSANESTMTALGKTIALDYTYFDGTGGQSISTLSPATTFTGQRLADVKLSSDMYGGLDWTTAYKTVEVTRIAKVDGEDCYAVAFAPKEGTKFTEYYSTKTFLLLKREGVQPLPGGIGELPYSILYSDYREVDGLKMPFRQVSNSISSGNVVSTIKTIKQNVPVDDKVFAAKKLKF